MNMLGRGCCCSTDPTEYCCKTSILKPYVSHTGTGDFSAVSDTNWVTSGTDTDPHFVTGDVPSGNTLPANSTIEFTADICCYDYLFDIQMFDIDPLDDETVIRCGASRWKAKEGDRLIQSSLEYYNVNSTRDYSAVQFSSYLGTNGVLHEVNETSHTYWNTDSGVYPFNAETDSDEHYIRSINNPSSFAGSATRTVRLTIATGQYPIKIGGVTFIQGVNSVHNSGGVAPCMKIRGVPTSYRRGNDLSGLVPSNQNATTGEGGVEQAWRLNSAAEAELAGYGTFSYSWERKGVADSGCNVTTQPHVSGSVFHDLSSLNGIYQLSLIDNRTDEWADPSVFAGVGQMVQSCANGIFNHDDNIFEHWHYSWKETILDAFNFGGTNADCINSDPTLCSTATAVPNGSCSFTKDEPTSVGKWLNSTTESPCCRDDYNAISMSGGIVACTGEAFPAAGEFWNPSQALPFPDFQNVEAEETAWVSCNDGAQTALHTNIDMPDGLTGGIAFGQVAYWPNVHSNSDSSTVNGGAYGFRQPLTQAQVGLVAATSQAEQQDVVLVTTINVQTGGDTFTAVSDQTNATGGVNGQTFVNKYESTSAFTATVTCRESHCFLGNKFADTDVDSRSIRFSHADDNTGVSKLFKNCLTDFEAKREDVGGDSSISTTIWSQDAAVDVVLPVLTLDLEEPDPFDPFGPWVPKYRPSGVYNDGKLYYYGDRTGFDRIEEHFSVSTLFNGVTVPKFLEVTDTTGGVWHIVFDKDNQEVRSVTNNFVVRDFNVKTYTDGNECDPTEFEWRDGTYTPNTTVWTFTFKLKGQE